MTVAERDDLGPSPSHRPCVEAVPTSSDLVSGISVEEPGAPDVPAEFLQVPRDSLLPLALVGGGGHDLAPVDPSRSGQDRDRRIISRCPAKASSIEGVLRMRRPRGAMRTNHWLQRIGQHRSVPRTSSCSRGRLTCSAETMSTSRPWSAHTRRTSMRATAGVPCSARSGSATTGCSAAKLRAPRLQQT